MTYVKIQKIIHEKTSFLDPLPGVKSNLEYLVDKVREICSLIHIELQCDELPPTSLQHFWGIIKNVTPVAKTNKWDLKNASIGAIMQTIKENDSILHQYKQMIFILKSIVIDLGNDEKYPNAETPTKRNKHNCIDQLNEILSVHKCFQQVFTSVINTSLAQEEAADLHVIHTWQLEGESTLRSPRFRFSENSTVLIPLEGLGKTLISRFDSLNFACTTSESCSFCSKSICCCEIRRSYA